MQIDFHHAVTYVAARDAGFNEQEADIIAHSAQYVDDSINQGIIKFDTGAMYECRESSHNSLDYRNFNELANHHVWLSFHFMPGNDGKKAEDNPSESFAKKIICRPGSFIAQEIVRDCISNQDMPYSLHRLGVTMHAYTDTWAHQGFAGVIHKKNDISQIKALNNDDDKCKNIGKKLKKFFENSFDEISSKLIGDVVPLGHGAALTFPDLPFLKWSYVNSDGQLVERNNTDIFIQAADEMCKAMKRFRMKNPDAEVPGLSDKTRQVVHDMFVNTKDHEGEDRHKKWLDAISQGKFGFPGVQLNYVVQGPGSWSQDAIGINLRMPPVQKVETETGSLGSSALIQKDKSLIMSTTYNIKYGDSFLTSNWRRFHDALTCHRFKLITEILPKYKIFAV